MKQNKTLLIGALLAVSSLNLGTVHAQEDSRLLVANEAGGALEISAKTGQVLHTYKTGPDAFGALYSKDGKRSFVTDKKEGRVIEVDPKTNEVIAKSAALEKGADPSRSQEPQQPVITSEGIMYVPLSNGEGVAVVDTRDGLKILSEEKIQTGSGSKPHILSLSSDERYLWATVQGTDPRVIAIDLKASKGSSDRFKNFRYDIVPRVLMATNQGAYFTGHHSTGAHFADLATGSSTTPFMDVNGNASEAKKQIEGVAVSEDGDLIALTHEGRKALIVVSKSKNFQKVCEILNLKDRPYWVNLDSSNEVAFVSIPGAGVVEAYDIEDCNQTALWSTATGGKAKRMALAK